VSDGPKPWQQQKGESRKAYHSFVHYRDMLPRERSMAQAFTQHQVKCMGRVAPGCDPGEIPLVGLETNKRWKVWKREFNWDARADANDADIAARDREKRAQEIVDMNTRHAQLATAFQNKLVQRLNSMDAETMTVTQFILGLREMTAIERRARGQATDIVKTVGDQPKRDLSTLTEEEFEQLERLIGKIEKGPEVET